MRLRTVKLVVVVLLAACALPVVWLSSETSSDTQTRMLTTGRGNSENLRAIYNEWEAEYIKNGGDSNLVLPLRWSRGLSDDYTAASGYTKLDMIDGKVTVAVTGLAETNSYDFWLVENRSIPGHTIMPEQGDNMVQVGTLKREGKLTSLQAALGSEAFANFRPDLAIVTLSGKRPEESRVITGNTGLFNSLYRSGQLGHFGQLEGSTSPAPSSAEKAGFFTRLIDTLMPTAQAQEQKLPPDLLELSIANGRRLFFLETFAGNGRTCGTCHRENDSFTIDPTFIATLGPLDPLFIAENDDNLRALENPAVMRGTGDILENLDGFDKPGVLRGVPHTLAMARSRNPDATVLAGGFSDALGWSGDGSPTGDILTIPVSNDPGAGNITITTRGSLRDFAIGAVTQHFPKRLNRVRNVDFRLPNLSELNDLEAFQLSLGRQRDLQLSPDARNPLRLRSPLASTGQNLFITPFVPGGASCNTCHSNAGANTPAGVNGNFDTNVEDLALQPARLIDPTIPLDGGFGRTPCIGTQPCGDARFNAPPLVEAADTGPFFHNNSINTIEAAVQFYQFGIPASFPSPQFGPSQVQAIAAFLRVINALENIRSSVDLETRALQEADQAAAAELLEISISELNDAIRVLTTASLHPVAAQRLREAIQLDQEAIGSANPDKRRQNINEALCKKTAARMDMELGLFAVCDEAIGIDGK
jgi:mono/diheme cytochrome c family protein